MSDSPIPPDERPVGFWLKLVDRLIDERLDATLAQDGLTRRGWQVLNLVRRDATTLAAIDDRLRPFLGRDEPTAAPVVDELRIHGWLERRDGRLAMTADGAARFADLHARVSADRRALAADIDAAEYQRAIAVLEKMARNLGWRP